MVIVSIILTLWFTLIFSLAILTLFELATIDDFSEPVAYPMLVKVLTLGLWKDD